METNTIAVQNFLDRLLQGAIPVRRTNKVTHCFGLVTDDDGNPKITYAQAINDNLIAGVLTMTPAYQIRFETESFRAEFELPEIKNVEGNILTLLSVADGEYSVEWTLEIL